MKKDPILIFRELHTHAHFSNRGSVCGRGERGETEREERNSKWEWDLNYRKREREREREREKERVYVSQTERFNIFSRVGKPKRNKSRGFMLKRARCFQIGQLFRKLQKQWRLSRVTRQLMTAGFLYVSVRELSMFLCVQCNHTMMHTLHSVTLELCRIFEKQKCGLKDFFLQFIK